jgi:acyl-CoA thioester hydrolase
MLTHDVNTRVRFQEIDAAGIAFYPNFFGWFDLATHELIRLACGNPIRNEKGQPRHLFPIVDAGASFSAPLLFDDEIVIRSTVAELRASSLRIEHMILRDGVTIASGFEWRVHVRSDGNRIVSAPIPEDVRRGLTVGDEDLGNGSAG